MNRDILRSLALRHLWPRAAIVWRQPKRRNLLAHKHRLLAIHREFGNSTSASLLRGYQLTNQQPGCCRAEQFRGPQLEGPELW